MPPRLPVPSPRSPKALLDLAANPTLPSSLFPFQQNLLQSSFQQLQPLQIENTQVTPSFLSEMLQKQPSLISDEALQAVKQQLKQRQQSVFLPTFPIQAAADLLTPTFPTSGSFSVEAGSADAARLVPNTPLVPNTQKNYHHHNYHHINNCNFKKDNQNNKTYNNNLTGTTYENNNGKSSNFWAL